MSDASNRVDQTARIFQDNKNLKKKVEEREKILKDQLRSLLDDYGEPDNQGHRWVAGRDFLVKHEARKSVVFDYAKAEGFLRANDVWEEGTVVIPERREMTEDSFLGWAYENDIPPEDFFQVTTTWAIKVTEEDQVEY